MCKDELLQMLCLVLRKADLWVSTKKGTAFWLFPRDTESLTAWGASLPEDEEYLILG